MDDAVTAIELGLDGFAAALPEVVAVVDGPPPPLGEQAAFEAAFLAIAPPDAG